MNHRLSTFLAINITLQIWQQHFCHTTWGCIHVFQEFLFIRVWCINCLLNKFISLIKYFQSMSGQIAWYIKSIGMHTLTRLMHVLLLWGNWMYVNRHLHADIKHWIRSIQKVLFFAVDRIGSGSFPILQDFLEIQITLKMQTSELTYTANISTLFWCIFKVVIHKKLTSYWAWTIFSKNFTDKHRLALAPNLNL